MTTCETLPLFDSVTLESGLSTPSAADSRAKTSRWLEAVQVCSESEADFGESSPAWLASFDHASRSWRTSGLFEAEDSPQFSQTLPRSGMTRNGTLYLLPPLVRLIYASGCGSSQLLPTPTQDSATMRTGRYAQGGMPLSLAATRLMPTPLASDAEQAGGLSAYERGTRGLSLTTWARLDVGSRPMLPTPQAQDHRNCADYSDGSRGHSPQLRHLGSGRLNPRFVEWMMGFPPGWTDASELDASS